VVGNANRLRRYHPAPLGALGQDHAEPQVETPGDYATDGVAAALATDPVCGMSVDRGTAAVHRSTAAGIVYFCSAGCAAAFDAEPGRYAGAATASAPASGAVH
jgi:Cu+-exporting ATPase